MRLLERPTSIVKRWNAFELAAILFALLILQITAESQPFPLNQLRVAAASDLTKPLREIADKFESVTGKKVVLIFGASGLLKKQIENGAPFDVFACANEAYVDQLIAAKHALPESKTLYALGHIGIWTRLKGNLPKRLEGLLSPKYGKIAIANPETAPYGKAAKEAMLKAKIWDALMPKLVYGENVLQAFQFAKSGNADAAFISQSSAFDAEGGFFLLPENLSPALKQCAAVLVASKQPEVAKNFLVFLTGKDGQSVLKKYGMSFPIRASVPKKGR